MRPTRPSSKNAFEVLDVEDSGDESFEASNSGSSTESESDSNNVSMKEISTMLPSKTVPEHSSKASKPHLRTKKSDKAKGKRRQRSQSPARDSVDAPPSDKQRRIAPAQLGREASNVSLTSDAGRASRTRNVIYEFYEHVDLNKYGVPGDDGDKHYKCLHGASKIITVKRSQKHSVNGLVGHLLRRVPPMHRLYEILKRRSESPTQEELDIAAGKNHLDSAAASAYLGKLETASNSILAAFRKQTGESVSLCLILNLLHANCSAGYFAASADPRRVTAASPVDIAASQHSIAASFLMTAASSVFIAAWSPLPRKIIWGYHAALTMS
ncbi:hypothetical protein B0H13DRAFT_1918506 [Mycena leptocephala]|nr:hypothetical protein B0H13DRAFT_1918506 [Mycena leptocephala]